MAHVDTARRIGEHFKQIIFFLVVIEGYFEYIFFFPKGLPLMLDNFGIICSRRRKTGQTTAQNGTNRVPFLGVILLRQNDKTFL